MSAAGLRSLQACEHSWWYLSAGAGRNSSFKIPLRILKTRRRPWRPNFSAAESCQMRCIAQAGANGFCAKFVLYVARSFFNVRFICASAAYVLAFRDRPRFRVDALFRFRRSLFFARLILLVSIFGLISVNFRPVSASISANRAH